MDDSKANLGGKTLTDKECPKCFNKMHKQYWGGNGSIDYLYTCDKCGYGIVIEEKKEEAK
jgi:hypothetical protein